MIVDNYPFINQQAKTENPEIGFELTRYTEQDFVYEEETDPEIIREAIEELRRDREYWEREIRPRAEAFQTTRLYAKLAEILDEIQDSNDSIETTARQHVIGYIVCTLKIADLLKENDESEKYPKIEKPE